GTLVRAAGEVRRAGQQPAELRLAPEERAHVEAARRGAVEEIEERAARTRQHEVALDERHRHPHARARGLDRRGDAAEGGLAVDERADGVSRPGRVGAAARERDGIAHPPSTTATRSEEHTSELQSPYDLVCRLLLEK